MGKAKYKALPVDDPSARHVAVTDRPVEVIQLVQTPAAPTAVEASSARTVGTAPELSHRLLDALGVGAPLAERTEHAEPSGIIQALSSAVTGLASGVGHDQASRGGHHDLRQGADEKVVMHDANDQEQGMFADFAALAPGEAVRAGVSDTEARAGCRSSDYKRMTDYVASLRYASDDSYLVQGMACFLRWGVKPLLMVAMAYVWVGKKVYSWYLLLPTNLAQMCFGLGLCFFGGVFFTSIAAVEAAVNMGGAEMWEHLKVCWKEGALIAEASRIDDALDEDHDGTADVLQMSLNDFATHKAKVAMVAVRQPERLQQAVFALANVYIAVIATLKFEFAKTVAVALGIANMLTLPLTHAVGPLFAVMMGKDLFHWVPAIIDTIIKIVAVAVACFIQSFICAFYSGLRGGRLFAEGLLNICSERGWMDNLPDCLVAKPFNPDASRLDEVLAYTVGAAGFYAQVSCGFSVMFPFNLALFPLTVIEWVLRFQVYT